MRTSRIVVTPERKSDQVGVYQERRAQSVNVPTLGPLDTFGGGSSIPGQHTCERDGRRRGGGGGGIQRNSNQRGGGG